MTVAEILTRARAQIHETSEGYILDSQIYKFQDSAQNAIIDFELAKIRALRAQGIDWQSPLLAPLMVLDSSNTTTVGSSYQEYTLPTDYLDTAYAEYSTSNAGTKYVCTFMDFPRAVKRGKNTFTCSSTSPIAYTRQEKLGFFPQPSGAGANNYIHYYYKTPTAVASGSELTLREECHEAVLEYTLYMIHTELREYEKAQVHRNNFLQFLTGA